MEAPFPAVAPSPAIRMIAWLGFVRPIVLRLYNRLLMTFVPRHRVRTVFGSMVFCDVRDMIQATLIHFRAWEPRSTQVFADYLQPGDVVADVGANIGYYALLFGKCVGVSGQVVAVEPLPASGEKLRENLAANGVANVRLAAVAVAQTRSSITLYEASRTNVGMTTTRSDRGFAQGLTVEGLPLHDILDGGERAKLAMIKIDIEGAEVPVVADFLDHLALYPAKPAIAVEADADEPGWVALFDRMLRSGYRAFDLHNDYDWLRLIDSPERTPSEIWAMQPAQADILFLPDTDRGKAFAEKLSRGAKDAATSKL